MTSGQRKGEAVVVVLRHSVYEGEVMIGWTEAERERYYDADPEARKQFGIQAAEQARGSGAPDIEVYVDGDQIWTNQ